MRMAYIGGSTFPRSKEYLHGSRPLRTKHPANLSICRLKDPKERHLHHTVSRRPSAKMSKNFKSTPDFGGVHDSMWRDPQSISRASTPCWQAMLSRHLESQSSQPLSEALRQERGPPIRNVQSTPDLGSPHDSIWQGPQSSSRASTPSWQAMLSRHMESLALRSTAQGPRPGYWLDSVAAQGGKQAAAAAEAVYRQVFHPDDVHWGQAEAAPQG